MATKKVFIIPLIFFLVALWIFAIGFICYSFFWNKEPSPESTEQTVPFVGRMVMPSVEAIDVVENTAGRDMDKIATYIQGRAAGLHWLSQEHFQKARREKKNKDMTMQVEMSIDSLGFFRCGEISFYSSNAEDMKEKLKAHIESLWRYTRSTKGSTKIIVPIYWRSGY